MQALIAEHFTIPAPARASALPCERCDGGGQFIGRNGRAIGPCFACKGTGRKARPTVAGPVVNDEALRAAFDKLRASGLKRISLRMQGFKVKPAPETGRNAGALYVTEGETYLGKIVRGVFDCTAACSGATATKVAALIADPMAAIKASGQETGNCAVCGLELTDPDSIAIGIGPICLGRLS